jgi:dihydroorotate dehydrogenase
MNLHDLATRALHGLDPEDAHRMAILGLKLGLGPRDHGPGDPILATTVAGMALPNCIGLAAGFDKDAEVADAMLGAGFGFVECGTVTPLPQAGNPRPRLFRLTEDQAVINRMGFNNRGLDAYTARMAGRKRRGIVGANIGANKDAGDRVADYVSGLKRVAGLCDYVTVNVSSPNTPGLRALQTRAALDELLGRLAGTRAELEARQPVFLKVAPDLEADEPAEIAAAVRRHGFDGIIVSNTTVARPETLTSEDKAEIGGLSGAPLLEPSTEMLRAFRQADATLPLIGVGGIASGAHAYAKIRAGADAVQLYSALVYGGPGLVVRIKRELAALLRADGFASVAQARG